MAKPHRMGVVIGASVLAADGYQERGCPAAMTGVVVGSAFAAWRRMTAGAQFLRKKVTE